VRRADAEAVGKFGPFIAAAAAIPSAPTPAKSKAGAESESGDEEIEPCENCGKPMGSKRGRFGQFLACTGYPECKTTRKLIATKQGGLRAAKPDQILDEKCPRCSANLVLKQGRFGEFTACTNYPECKYIKHKTTGAVCPKDADKGGEIVERKSKRGKMFFGCSNYPDCDFVLWNRPDRGDLPEVQRPLLVEKTPRSTAARFLCDNEDCDYARSEDCGNDALIPEPYALSLSRESSYRGRRPRRLGSGLAGRFERRSGDAVRECVPCDRPRCTRPIAWPSSSAATRCAATSSITPSGCSRRKCGGSTR
jgi:ssDNA-binding Zn-finger/Zn-ribbon topoisomerase 1